MAEEKISMKTYGIVEDEILDDLTEYYKKIYNNKKQKIQIERKYKSVEDYVNILYWIKFIKKMNYREMGELTGNYNFYQRYSNSTFFWHYDTDSLAECERMYKEELKILQDKQFRAHNYSEKNMPSKYFDYINNILPEKNLQLLAKCYGHNDVLTFIKEIYYLRFIENFTTTEFRILYDKSGKAINSMLRNLNCNPSMQESQANVVKRGRRNYAKSFITRRENHINNVLTTGLMGSNEENICRLMINDKLIELIGSSTYEIVVGVSNRTIIAPYEIDIPVIIINKKNHTIIKYAVDYNGDVWHRNRKNADKYKELQLKNSVGNTLLWNFIQIMAMFQNDLKMQ